MKKKVMSIFLVVALVAIAAVGTLAYFTDSDEVANTFTVGHVAIDLFETAEDGTEVDDGLTYEKPIMPGTEFPKDPTIRVEEGSQDSYIFLDMSMNRYKSLVPVMALDAVEQKLITQDQFDACMVGEKFSTLTFLQKMAATPDTFRAIMNRWFVGITHSDWQICGFFYDTKADDLNATGNYMTIRFAYIGAGDPILSAKETVTFMTMFKMPDTVTSEMLDNGLTANEFNAKGEFHLNFKAYAIQAAEIDSVADAFTNLFGDLDDLGDYYYKVTLPA